MNFEVEALRSPCASCGAASSADPVNVGESHHQQTDRQQTSHLAPAPANHSHDVSRPLASSRCEALVPPCECHCSENYRLHEQARAGDQSHDGVSCNQCNGRAETSPNCQAPTERSPARRKGSREDDEENEPCRRNCERQPSLRAGYSAWRRRRRRYLGRYPCIFTSTWSLLAVLYVVVSLTGLGSLASTQQGIADVDAVVGRAFTFSISNNRTDSTIVVTEAGHASLPPWLHYYSDTRTLVGVPSTQDIGEVYIQVTEQLAGRQTQDVFKIDVDHDPKDQEKAMWRLSAGFDGGLRQPWLFAELPKMSDISHVQSEECSSHENIVTIAMTTSHSLDQLSGRERYRIISSAMRYLNTSHEHLQLTTVDEQAQYAVQLLAAGAGSSSSSESLSDGHKMQVWWNLACGSYSPMISSPVSNAIESVERTALDGSLAKALGVPIASWELVHRRHRRQVANPAASHMLMMSSTPIPTPTVSLLLPTAITTIVTTVLDESSELTDVTSVESIGDSSPVFEISSTDFMLDLTTSFPPLSTPEPLTTTQPVLTPEISSSPSLVLASPIASTSPQTTSSTSMLPIETASATTSVPVESGSGSASGSGIEDGSGDTISVTPSPVLPSSPTLPASTPASVQVSPSTELSTRLPVTTSAVPTTAIPSTTAAAVSSPFLSSSLSEAISPTSTEVFSPSPVQITTSASSSSAVPSSVLSSPIETTAQETTSLASSPALTIASRSVSFSESLSTPIQVTTTAFIESGSGESGSGSGSVLPSPIETTAQTDLLTTSLLPGTSSRVSSPVVTTELQSVGISEVLSTPILVTTTAVVESGSGESGSGESGSGIGSGDIITSSSLLPTVSTSITFSSLPSTAVTSSRPVLASSSLVPITTPIPDSQTSILSTSRSPALSLTSPVTSSATASISMSILATTDISGSGSGSGFDSGSGSGDTTPIPTLLTSSPLAPATTSLAPTTSLSTSVPTSAVVTTSIATTPTPPATTTARTVPSPTAVVTNATQPATTTLPTTAPSTSPTSVPTTSPTTVPDRPPVLGPGDLQVIMVETYNQYRLVSINQTHFVDEEDGSGTNNCPLCQLNVTVRSLSSTASFIQFISRPVGGEMEFYLEIYIASASGIQNGSYPYVLAAVDSSGNVAEDNFTVLFAQQNITASQGENNIEVTFDGDAQQFSITPQLQINFLSNFTAITGSMDTILVGIESGSVRLLLIDRTAGCNVEPLRLSLAQANTPNAEGVFLFPPLTQFSVSIVPGNCPASVVSTSSSAELVLPPSPAPSLPITTVFPEITSVDLLPAFTTVLPSMSSITQDTTSSPSAELPASTDAFISAVEDIATATATSSSLLVPTQIISQISSSVTTFSSSVVDVISETLLAPELPSSAAFPSSATIQPTTLLGVVPSIVQTLVSSVQVSVDMTPTTQLTPPSSLAVQPTPSTQIQPPSVVLSTPTTTLEAPTPLDTSSSLQPSSVDLFLTPATTLAPPSSIELIATTTMSVPEAPFTTLVIDLPTVLPSPVTTSVLSDTTPASTPLVGVLEPSIPISPVISTTDTLVEPLSSALSDLLPPPVSSTPEEGPSSPSFLASIATPVPFTTSTLVSETSPDIELPVASSPLVSTTVDLPSPSTAVETTLSLASPTEVTVESSTPLASVPSSSIAVLEEIASSQVITSATDSPTPLVMTSSAEQILPDLTSIISDLLPPVSDITPTSVPSIDELLSSAPAIQSSPVFSAPLDESSSPLLVVPAISSPLESISPDFTMTSDLLLVLSTPTPASTDTAGSGDVSASPTPILPVEEATSAFTSAIGSGDVITTPSEAAGSTVALTSSIATSPQLELTPTSSPLVATSTVLLSSTPAPLQLDPSTPVSSSEASSRPLVPVPPTVTASSATETSSFTLVTEVSGSGDTTSVVEFSSAVVLDQSVPATSSVLPSPVPDLSTVGLFPVETSMQPQLTSSAQELTTTVIPPPLLSSPALISSQLISSTTVLDITLVSSTPALDVTSTTEGASPIISTSPAPIFSQLPPLASTSIISSSPETSDAVLPSISLSPSLDVSLPPISTPVIADVSSFIAITSSADLSLPPLTTSIVTVSPTTVTSPTPTVTTAQPTTAPVDNPPILNGMLPDTFLFVGQFVETSIADNHFVDDMAEGQACHICTLHLQLLNFQLEDTGNAGPVRLTTRPTGANGNNQTFLQFYARPRHEGTHQLTLQARDSSGNLATDDFAVHVVPVPVTLPPNLMEVTIEEDYQAFDNSWQRQVQLMANVYNPIRQFAPMLVMTFPIGQGSVIARIVDFSFIFCQNLRLRQAIFRDTTILESLGRNATVNITCRVPEPDDPFAGVAVVSTSSQSTSSQNIIIPVSAVLGAALLIAFVGIVYYRRRRPERKRLRGTRTRLTFDRRNPILLAEERDVRSRRYRPPAILGHDGAAPLQRRTTSVRLAELLEEGETASLLADLEEEGPNFNAPPPFHVAMQEKQRRNPPPAYQLPPDYTMV